MVSGCGEYRCVRLCGGGGGGKGGIVDSRFGASGSDSWSLTALMDSDSLDSSTKKPCTL